MFKFQELLQLEKNIKNKKRRLDRFVKLSNLKYNKKLKKRIFKIGTFSFLFCSIISFIGKSESSIVELTAFTGFNALVLSFVLFFISVFMDKDTIKGILYYDKISKKELKFYLADRMQIDNLTNKEINIINKIKLTKLENEYFSISNDKYSKIIKELKSSSLEEIEKEKETIINYAKSINDYEKQQALLKILREKINYNNEIDEIAKNIAINPIKKKVINV